jgi:hypothetical protein
MADEVQEHLMLAFARLTLHFFRYEYACSAPETGLLQTQPSSAGLNLV